INVYERLYYQYNPQRLPTCPLTVHALLHIASSIRACGPVWCYWAFPMERYCGMIQLAIRSRRFPYASLGRHVLEDARLTQIKVLYDVADDLSLKPPRLGPVRGSYEHHQYLTCRLLPPRSPDRPAINTLNLLIGALVTRFTVHGGNHVTPKVVKQYLEAADIQEWGKVQRIDSDVGETMRASAVGKIPDDNRDTFYVLYEMYVDVHATRRNLDPVYKLETFYGQLQHIYLIHFNSACSQLNLLEPSTTIIMAQIKSCRVDNNNEIEGLDVHFYSSMGNTDVVDITSIQCLVGRVPVGHNRWAIVDKSGPLARALSQLDDDELGDN
ncbi:hypothetical protein K435DRAFT_571382, partial [Dendrothele bispora CBS 962.96]